MKYKLVLLENNSGGGNPDVATTLFFYRKNEAISCANQWKEIGATKYAYLWDGTIWTLYTN
jgi:hypothetical protein